MSIDENDAQLPESEEFQIYDAFITATDFATRIMAEGFRGNGMRIRFDNAIPPDVLCEFRETVTNCLTTKLTEPALGGGSSPLYTYSIFDFMQLLDKEISAAAEYLEQHYYDPSNTDARNSAYTFLAFRYIALQILMHSAEIEYSLCLIDNHKVQNNVRDVATSGAAVVRNAFLAMITEWPEEYENKFPRFWSRFIEPRIANGNE